MYFASIATLAAVLTAALVDAETPPDFTPVSSGDLFIVYGDRVAADGDILQKDATQSVPVVGTAEHMEGTYVLMMIDTDIPTSSPPQTDTLLHWMQTDLASSTTPTSIRLADGKTAQFFALTNSTAPAAPYLGPNPPARVPLSHQYTLLLVDTADDPQSAAPLEQAAQTRRGFNVNQVLADAGLENDAVAGGYYIVSNPGPVTNGTDSAPPPPPPTSDQPAAAVPSGPTVSIGILAMLGIGGLAFLL